MILRGRFYPKVYILYQPSVMMILLRERYCAGNSNLEKGWFLGLQFYYISVDMFSNVKVLYVHEFAIRAVTWKFIK